MCGEHVVVVAAGDETWGSSPHVRGAPDAVGGQLRGGGIIPACAGSTTAFRLPAASVRDHPRMCGEHNLGVSHKLN